MLKQRKKAIMFPFLWTPEGTLWCSTNAPQRVIKGKIDPLFFFNQDLAIYVVRKEDTGIVFFVFPAKSRLPTKTQIIAKHVFVGPLQRVRPRNGILALGLVLVLVVLPLRSEFIGEL